MMQLLCNGVYLDLEDNVKLSFKNSNPLFAFENIQCERTTEFTLPDTPKNNRVFSLSKKPAFYGTGMRRRFVAQLTNGVCVKDGYLYVSKFSNGGYKAIFVTGEMIGLQSIKNVGKISDIINCEEVCEWQNYSPAEPDVLWGMVQYIHDGGAFHPSYNIKGIIDRVVEQNNLAHITLPDSADGLRIVVGEPKLLQPTHATFNRGYENAYADSTQVYPSPIVNTISAESGETAIGGIFGETLIGAEYTSFVDGIRTWTLEGRVRHLVAKQPLSITFPSDWPQGLYIGKLVGSGIFENAVEFYGERSFTKMNVGGQITINRIGDPLAGRTIEIEAGTAFIFFREDDYLVYDSQTTSGTQGWRVNTNLNATCDIEGKGDASVGNVLRLQDNLPDMTLVELLKVVAAATHTSLYYTEADGVTFNPVNIATWSFKELTSKLVSIGDVERSFSNYAKANIVKFDSDETIPAAQRIMIAYEIDNDNLELEKVLQTIPFSEGYGETYNGVQVLGIYEGNTKDTIADVSQSVNRLIRVQLVQNAGVAELCRESTKAVASVRLTQYDFDQITPMTKILLQGTLYVWTDATWSDGVAKFTLAKI